MAVGKSQAKKGGKKGLKKKVVDPFSKKEWYNIKAPSVFSERNVGKTIVTRSQGTKLASDGLKGRVYEVCLADLHGNEDYSWRKVKLRCEAIQGKDCLTSFHGMDFTTDKRRSLVRKWQTLIECSVDVKTTDGFVLRMFCIGFTKRRPTQVKKTSYAQTAQIKLIRSKMSEIMTKEGSACDLKELVSKFIPGVIGKEIEKSCRKIYPLHDVYIRKVKVVRAPKLDMAKFLEQHADSRSEDKGTEVERPAEEEEEEETKMEEDKA